MAEALTGNVLVAQSGGPSAVANAALAGIITEALNHDEVEEIYGALNGVVGILNEEFIDLAEESQQAIRGLRHTPGAALGSSRFNLRRDVETARILQVFESHNIRYFFLIGGMDTQLTAARIEEAARSQGYAVRVLGIPATIANDIPATDHCLGYGSAVKYLATTVKEMSLDHEAMGQHDLVSVVEVMGRNSGWVAAGATAGRRRNQPDDPPHLILIPEVPFNPDFFMEHVQAVLKKHRFCSLVVAEGIVDEDGNFLSAGEVARDSFGHEVLGGAGDIIRQLVEERLGVRVRSAKMGIAQRAAGHCISKTDAEEAFRCGQTSVERAIAGASGKLVALVRGDGETYSSETSLVPLEELETRKAIPANWINEDGVSMNFQFNKYAQPLIEGELEVPYESGVPQFVSLSRRRVPRQCEPWSE